MTRYDLEDSVEALDFWHRRSRRLPWYRIRARREALEMMVRWERRVGTAVVSRHRAPLESRVNAGVLVARARLNRWARRARIAALATVATAMLLVAIPTVAAIAFLIHAL